MTAHHIHLDDAPDSLAILHALLGHRADRAAEIGYVIDETGAMVDWDLLENSWLSTTEVATVQIARACATVEAHGGGLPNEVSDAVWYAIDGITKSRRR